MKSISIWAHTHKAKARLSIFVIYLFLNIAGLFLGDILYSMNIELPEWILLVAVLLTIGGTIWYPAKKLKSVYQNYYFRRKLADSILVMTTFIFIIFTGNQINNSRSGFINNSIAGTIIPAFVSVIPNNVSVDKEIPTKTISKKAQRKSFKNWVKSVRKTYKSEGKSNKTLMIILVVIGAAVLSYFLVGLACSLACSGSEALAFIIGIIGIAGIVFGAIKLIQRITRGKRD